jgi:hypothetical protein
MQQTESALADQLLRDVVSFITLPASPVIAAAYLVGQLLPGTASPASDV